MPSRSLPLIVALLLILIAASRITLLASYPMDVDEVWSIWQTFGTPAEILRWTPYDWPPLHYQVVGIWRALAGSHPIAVRFLSVLISLIGAAWVYRLARKLGGASAGLLTMLAYGGLAFSVHIGVIVRGYVLLVALLPLALWLALRYFEQPNLGRALLLALSMAAMFYTHLTSIFAFVVIGLFTLVLHRGAIWRWWLPGALAGLLAAPEIIDKARIAVGRLAGVQQVRLPALPEALTALYADFVGEAAGLWLGLALGAGTALVFRPRWPAKFALGLWLLMPALIYAVNPVFGFFGARYIAWMLVGIALWVGVGLASLPRAVQSLAALALIVALAWPIIPARYVIPGPPMLQTFPLLAQVLRPGDVVLRDPRLREAPPEMWDYFTLVYFANGLEFVSTPADHRRIWYVATDGEQDPATKRAVEADRIPGVFFGPWDFLIRLYEAPPDKVGVLFENGMRFHGADILNATSPKLPVFREGQTVKVRMWWSVDRVVRADYSMSVQLAAPDGTLLAQNDESGVVSAPRETSQWQPGRYYLDEREIALPVPLATGTYALNLAVYQWWDGVRLAAPGVGKDRLFLIHQINVKSW